MGDRGGKLGKARRLTCAREILLGEAQGILNTNLILDIDGQAVPLHDGTVLVTKRLEAAFRPVEQTVRPVPQPRSRMRSPGRGSSSSISDAPCRHT